MMPWDQSVRLTWECMQRFYDATETNLWWETNLCMQGFYDATETNESVCRGSESESMQRFYDATETNLRVYAEILWCHWD